MAGRELKTQKTGASVSKFLGSIPDEKRKADCMRLLDVMSKATGAEAKMWGSTIVGFGEFSYPAGGKENDWFLAGFSPRKQNLTIYLMTGFSRYPEIMERLGKHKTSVSCLYIKKLDDISIPVLTELIETGMKDLSNAKR
jgi:hypothetical protein